MIDPSEGKQIQRDYLEILDMLLNKIREKAKSQGLPSDKNISILIGKDCIYKGAIGQEPTRNTMTQSQVEMIEQVLSEPQNLKGSLRIMIGQDKVYHTKDGKVLTDKLGLSPSQSQSTKVTQNQQSRLPEVTPTASQSPTIDSLQQQIDALQQKIQEQQKLIDVFNSQQGQGQSFDIASLSANFNNLNEAVREQQKTVEKLRQGLEEVKNRATTTVKNSALQNWVGSFETKIKQTATSLYERVKTALTPKINKLQSQVDELKTQVNQQITRLETQISDFKSQTQSNIQNVRSDIEQRVDSVKTDTYEVIQDLQHKVSQQVQTVHTEVTKMAQSAHSKAVDTVQSGIQAVSNTVMEAKGKAIEKSVGAMLNVFGDKNADGSISFESQNYHFHQEGNTISIKSKDGRDVFMNGALTSSAREQDVQALEKVQQKVEDYLSHSESETQTSKLRH